MSSGRKKNIGHSVFQKLLNLSKEKKEDFNYLLLRYCIERLLFRLSKSSFADKFILKGASLFLIWQGSSPRVTKDADLMSFGSPDVSRLKQIFIEISQISCLEDGIIFQADSVSAFPIREDQLYGGIRITMKGKLDQAVIPVQIDIGFGDSIVPVPEQVSFPTLLDVPAPELHAYTRYSVVAEKFHAMVALGIANSRMKDFFDIWMLNNSFDFAGNVLSEAIKSTFERRQTEIPENLPFAFSREFSEDEQKQTQWKAFLRKTKPEAVPENFQTVIENLKKFLIPVVEALRGKENFEKTWSSVDTVWKE
ncbi:MAG: nucleotidyl transferase AbiEii/AbiGii toxin family protein [Victivallaceae bacterium]|nr:nucleotidyl transferase AbiEii/AbiGii toxin family protein [Victivallaceae bacterium]